MKTKEYAVISTRHINNNVFSYNLSPTDKFVYLGLHLILSRYGDKEDEDNNLVVDDNWLGINDIAYYLNMNKAEVFECMENLVNNGFVIDNYKNGGKFILPFYKTESNQLPEEFPRTEREIESSEREERRRKFQRDS